MTERFYIHEDDWGRISLEPEENRFDRTRIAGELRAFSDAHRAPDGLGWTDMMIVPPSPVSLDVRAITLEALRAALGSEARELSPVTTGYSTHVETVDDGFAFACGREEELHWDRIYGCVKAGVVTQLNVTHATPAIAALLHRLGTAFRLILCDLGRDGVIDLAVRAAVDRYFADDDT